MTNHDTTAILAIESSGKRLKLALSFGGDRLVKLDEEVNRSHGQVIIRKIEHLLQSAALAKGEIGAIVVGIGPGSFTGLRIGLAVAKGMATALSIPIVGVSHMEIAEQLIGSEFDHQMVLLPFKSESVFIVPMIDGKIERSKVNAVSFEALAGFVQSMPVAAVGFDPQSATALAFHKAGMRVIDFDASDLVTIGRQKLQAGRVDDLATLEPMYLQKSQAELLFDARHR